MTRIQERVGVSLGGLFAASLLAGALSACIPYEVEPDGGTEPERACGGLLGLRCNAGDYCDYPIEAICGAADQTGICRPIPEVCFLVVDPVCGCDDKTYNNSCFAARAGVSVAKNGACEEAEDDGGVGAFCGGIAGIQCAKGLYCNFPIEAQCGAADQGGTCQLQLDFCAYQEIPVCGCDDKTYGSACFAAIEGVSVSHLGACEP